MITSIGLVAFIVAYLAFDTQRSRQYDQDDGWPYWLTLGFFIAGSITFITCLLILCVRYLP